MEYNRMKMVLNHIQTFKNNDVEINMDKFNTLCNIVKLSEIICEDHDEIRIDFNECAISCSILRSLFLSFEGKEKEIVRNMIKLCDDIQIEYNRKNDKLVFSFIVRDYLVDKQK